MSVKSLNLIIIFTMSYIISSCSMSWKSGLYTPPSTNSGDASKFVSEAYIAAQTADTREKVERVVQLYQKALDIDPENRISLAESSHLLILLGTGYADNIKEKEFYFTEAIRYSERLMYLNSEFRKKINQGVPLWDAVNVLTAEDSDAMGWWTTSVLYYFRECIPVPFMPFNHKWVSRAAKLMQRIDEVNPNWNDGGNLFNLGIYYIALPERIGGDLKKAEKYLRQAAVAGKGRLLIPWGRAKYYYYRIKDRNAFKKNLEWVTQQDPKVAPTDPYPWNLYFQREAKYMLEHIDDYF